jgi:hypothetical protein
MRACTTARLQAIERGGKERERSVHVAGRRGPAQAARTEIVVVTTDLTRQKVRETNLLDRTTSWTTCVHCPQWFDTLAVPMVSSWEAAYICASGPGREQADGGTR